MENSLPEKYRPLSWEEVKGQDKVVEILKQQVITKKGLAKAYIFSGSSGIGKTTLARLFFMAMNCESPKNGNPCGKCTNCQNLKYNMNEINASDSRGIDDMRNITNEMYYKGLTGGNYKGILLDEVHMLTKPAFNCLLKPLEESPQHCIWFLCTTESAKIPATIRTRCQIYKLSPIRWKDIHNRLKEVSDKEKITISDNDLWQIAQNSDNNIRQSLHLLEKYVVIKDINKVLSSETNISFLESIRDKNIKDLWKLLVSFEDEYIDIDTFFNSLKYDLSMCIKIKMNLPMGEISPYRLNKYKKIASQIQLERLIKTLDIILELQSRISGVWDYNSLFLMTLIKLEKI